MKEERQQALAWISDNPSKFIWLTGRRAFLFWFGTEQRWYGAKFYPRPSIHIYWMMGVASIIELVRLLRRNHPAAGLILCTCLGTAAPYLITHVEERYRMPIVSVFALLSSNLAMYVVGRIASKIENSVPIYRLLLSFATRMHVLSRSERRQ